MAEYQKAGLEFGRYPKETPQPRKTPMKVLCLGLSRTGTMSTYLGLRRLGYHCYHAWELCRNDRNGSLPFWRQAIEAKYYGKRYKKLETAEDFDVQLWKYDAVSDIPCVHFSDELLKAYPDAKVILTERSVDGWINSIVTCLYAILPLRVWKVLQVVDTEMARDYFPILKYSVDIWTDHDVYTAGSEPNREALERGYKKYNQHIKDIVPKDRLLVWHPSQGWEPLCAFLHKEVPEGPFPKTNEGGRVAQHYDPDHKIYGCSYGLGSQGESSNDSWTGLVGMEEEFSRRTRDCQRINGKEVNRER